MHGATTDALAGARRKLGERLAVDGRRVSRALVVSEAGVVRRSFTANPEQRSALGFLVGWTLLLVSLFGTLSAAVGGDLLATMLQVRTI